MNSAKSMKIDTLYSGTIDRGTEWNYTIGQGFLNGIILTNPTSASTFITVRKRTLDGTEVLIQDQPLQDFAEISEIDFGANSGIIYRGLYRTWAETGSTAANPWAEYNSNDHNVLIPLGAHYLGDGSELEIKLRLEEEGARVDEKYSIGIYEDERQPAFSFQYERMQDLNANYPNVDALFLSWTTDKDQRDLDINLKVKDSESTFISRVQLLKSASQMLNNVEIGNEFKFLKFYQTHLPMPENVHVKITGTDAQDTAIIVRSRVYFESETSDNTIKELENLRKKVEELERKKPETAKALRHAGKIQKSEELAQAESEVKEAQKRDKEANE